MRFLLLLFLILLCSFPSFAGEEFYVVTDAPIAVGGGMIRHYTETEKGVISTRYSYGGTDPDAILIEKITSLPRYEATKKETLRVPYSHIKRKKGHLKIGSHAISLNVTKHGRVVVKEVRNHNLTR